MSYETIEQEPSDLHEALPVLAPPLLRKASNFNLYLLIIFPPLALGGALEWSVPIIQWMAFFAAYCMGLRRILGKEEAWTPTPLDWPLVALAAVCVISTVLSQDVSASLNALGLLLAYVAVFYVAIDAMHTRRSLRRLCFVIIGLGSFVALFGIFKYSGSNPFPWWDFQNQVNSSRLGATYYNSDHLAGLMEMTLCLSAGMLLAGLSTTKRLAIGLAGVFMAVALILSLSRGGWIGATIGLGFMGVYLAERRYFRRGIVMAGLVSAFVAVILVIIMSTPTVNRLLTIEQGGDMVSWSSRVSSWKATTAMIADHPVTGVGPGNFALVFTQYQPPGLGARFYHAHNDYLDFTSELGLIFVPVLLWMLFTLFQLAWYKLHNPSRLVRGTTLGALAGVVAILVHSAGDFNLHLPANALVFTILAAIIAAPVPKKG